MEGKKMNVVVEVKSKKEGDKLLRKQGYAWIGDINGESWYYNPVLKLTTKIINKSSDEKSNK